MPSDEKLEMAFGTKKMRINSPDKINVSLTICCFANITNAKKLIELQVLQHGYKFSDCFYNYWNTKCSLLELKCNTTS